MYYFNIKDSEILSEQEIANGVNPKEPKVPEYSGSAVNAPGSENELYDILMQIDKNYSTSQVGEYEKGELNLERLDAGQFSDEEARQKAENMYGQEMIDGRQNIEDKAAGDKEVLEKKKTTVAEETEKNRTALEELFDDRKKEASKDALNRGLARSSIIVSKIEAFDEGKIEQINKLNMEYSKAFTEIESSLASLESQKEAALKNFDLSYAVKINQKIEDLKVAYEKKVEEVAKYNNEIAQKEAEFKAKEQEKAQSFDKDAMSMNSTYWEALNKYGADVVNKKSQDEKFAYVDAYFKSLPPAEAYSVLQGAKFYRDAIGLTNYTKLLNELSGAKAELERAAAKGK